MFVSGSVQTERFRWVSRMCRVHFLQVLFLPSFSVGFNSERKELASRDLKFFLEE